MKRNYVSPTAEKVEFNYSEQVVAASGSSCKTIVSNNNYDQTYNCNSYAAATYNV